jgi:hypothetical protein
MNPQFPRLCRPMAFLVIAVLASSILMASAGSAQAMRIVGSKASDRIVGTAKADVIKARGGNDRVRGRGGRDRLWGGRGADRLNAVDGLRDRLVRGGPGRDVCRIDAADRAKVRGCETVKIASRGRPGGGGAPGGGAPGGAPGGGAPPVGAPPIGAPPAGAGCVAPPEEARVRVGGPAQAAGDPPPTFSDALYAITMTLDVSVEGLTGDELPISIEDVCDVPTQLQTEAAQLVGGEGVALITRATQVFDALGQQQIGDAATAAFEGADSVSLKAQLVPTAQWRLDEDGAPVPTFSTSRADITD